MIERKKTWQKSKAGWNGENMKNQKKMKLGYSSSTTCINGPGASLQTRRLRGDFTQPLDAV
jgi:hypothetical protein